MKILNFYLNNAPRYLKTDSTYFKISYDFADNLLSKKDSNDIKNTFVTRKYGDIKIRVNPLINCENPNCQKKNVIKWVRSKKACTTIGCQISFSEAFVTREQKQIDIMIATDLIHLAYENKCENIGLISNDLDFTPSVFYACSVFYPKFIYIVKSKDRLFYWESSNNIRNLIVCNY